MRLFLCEKSSQAKDIGKVLGVLDGNHDGYFQKGDTAITWVFGHILTQATPDAYGLFSEDKPSKSNRRLQENYCETSVMEFCPPYFFAGVNVQDMHDKCLDDFYEAEGVIILREQKIETHTTDIEAYRDKSARNSMWPSVEAALKLNNV